jgi:hypothetical protein
MKCRISEEAGARFRVSDVNSASNDCSPAYRRSNRSPLPSSTHHSIPSHRASQSYTNRNDELASEFYSDDDDASSNVRRSLDAGYVHIFSYCT